MCQHLRCKSKKHINNASKDENALTPLAPLAKHMCVKHVKDKNEQQA